MALKRHLSIHLLSFVHNKFCFVFPIQQIYVKCASQFVNDTALSLAILHLSSGERNIGNLHAMSCLVCPACLPGPTSFLQNSQCPKKSNAWQLETARTTLASQYFIKWGAPQKKVYVATEIWQRLYSHVLTLHFLNLLSGQTVLCNFQQIYFPIMAIIVFSHLELRLPWEWVDYHQNQTRGLKSLKYFDRVAFSCAFLFRLTDQKLGNNYKFFIPY